MISTLRFVVFCSIDVYWCDTTSFWFQFVCSNRVGSAAVLCLSHIAGIREVSTCHGIGPLKRAQVSLTIASLVSNVLVTQTDKLVLSKILPG